MIEILFRKNQEAQQEIKKVSDLRNIYVDISLRVDRQSVAKRIEFEGFFPVFIEIFLLTCLTMLPKLNLGQKGKFELDSPFELIFEPKNSKIVTYLSEEGKVPEERFEVELKDFVREAIKATQDFIDYVLGLRPDLEKRKTTMELQDKVKKAKNWYFQKYGEKL